MLEIGSTLREARTRAGLELASVEAATMIPVRYLEALENEQFERLPGAPYRRSFLREYARYLGLDANALDAEYELQHEPPEPEVVHAARGFTRASALDALTPGRLAALGVVALVALAAWLLGSSGGSNPPRRSAPAPAHHSKPAAVTTSPQRPAGREPPATPAPASPALTLVASRGPCWLLVQIGSRAGRTVYVETLQPGRAVSFGLRKPLWIRVGAPWNLDARIGRRSVTSALPALTGDVIATARGLHGTS
jgi:cytoskeletal protein RodZ